MTTAKIVTSKAGEQYKRLSMKPTTHPWCWEARATRHTRMSTPWRYAHVPKMLAAYKRAFAHLQANPNNTIAMSWASEPLDLEGFRANFRRALDRRITDKVAHRVTRKMDSMYQTELARDSWAIRDHATRRTIVHQLQTPELRKRFAHIIEPYD